MQKHPTHKNSSGFTLIELLTGSDKTLYQVFVDKFVDKRVAEKSTISLKEIENLDPFYQPARGTLEVQ